MSPYSDVISESIFFLSCCNIASWGNFRLLVLGKVFSFVFLVRKAKFSLACVITRGRFTIKINLINGRRDSSLIGVIHETVPKKKKKKENSHMSIHMSNNLSFSANYQNLPCPKKNPLNHHQFASNSPSTPLEMNRSPVD